MFDHKHYVPIIKTKAGERWAIDHLLPKIKKRLTPLFEIHRHKKKESAIHADDVVEDLASVWGMANPLFLDAIWLHGDSGDSALLDSIFATCRNQGLPAIPVAKLSFYQDAITSIRKIHKQDNRGCMLRVHADKVKPSGISAFMQELKLSKQNVDLLIDFKSQDMDLEAVLQNVPDIKAWRTLIAASGSFPRSMAGKTLHKWLKLDRRDYLSWESGVTSGVLERLPTFSDYTTRDTGAPAEGGQPSVQLRYTRDKDWAYQIGSKVKGGGSADMYKLCHELISKGWYSGANFSDGDGALNTVAASYNVTPKTAGPGAPQQWVQWGVNHHMKFVVTQLQNHPSL